VITADIPDREGILDAIKDVPREGALMSLPGAPAHPERDPRATRWSYGLDFFETFFEVLDYDEVNEIAAYGGFPTRYPHWRFGMEYEQLSRATSTGCRRSTSS
jgi:hypothetical protein